jgi:hypothetical protein
MESNIVLTDETKYLLLVILENDGNVESIKDLGYDYNQITELIKNEIKLKNIIFSDNKIEITQEGIKLKNYLAKKLNYSNLEALISPQLSDIIEVPVDSQIFIPSEKELPD